LARGPLDRLFWHEHAFPKQRRWRNG
jgi:hypothetical protein